MSRQIHIKIPDHITQGQINQALQILGFADSMSMKKLTLDFSAPRAVVRFEAGGVDYSIDRTWAVNGWPVRMGPEEE